MKRIITALFTILVCPLAGHAQYVTYGKIEYERKVNIYAQMQEMEEDGHNEWFERMKSQIPKFSSTFFDLVFDTSKSIYKPGREVEKSPFAMFGGGPATENIVLTDLTNKKVKSLKTVYEQKFAQADTMRMLQWKLVDEIRTIASYKCRKAVSRICDSVYVVAFYTEDIMASSGPEMFGGLPGMILELAVPRLHTTWVATKVEMIQPKEADYTMPDKGKKVNSKELYETLQSSFKSWGKMAARNIWWTTL